ncbi:MAG: anaerobic dehydrogenase, partial [Moraxellaceae bacterium]|nr:anaerobic dehydrogenase [Moraxellaceae bacterium]
LNRIREEHGPRAIGLAGIGGQGNHSNAFGAAPFLYSLGATRFFNALGQEKIQHILVDKRLFRGTHDTYLAADEHHADYVLILGSNPFLSHRGMNATESLKCLSGNPERTLVVVDPRITETSRRAKRHLRIKPAKDVYLLLALAGVIVQENLADQAFLRAKTRDHDKMLRLLARVDRQEMARRCELDVTDIEAVAREFAAAKTACINWDLGVEHAPNSTLNSYLIRVLLLLTGNLGRPGGNLFVQTFGPRIPTLGKMPRATVSGLEAVPMFMPLGGFSPNLIPEEILTDHPDRMRALIVDAANPMRSYVDTSRFREAFAQLDLLVVIEPAMTETARVADYVLPTPVGYEKWEISIFPKDVIAAQARPPLVNGPAEALPEVEIYYRLARAMGLVGPAPKMLHTLAKNARHPLVTPAYMGAVSSLAATRGGGLFATLGRSAFWFYETLGPTLPNPMLASVWLFSVGYALTRRHQLDRALPEARKLRNPFAAAELVFEKILAHPEGVIVGELDKEKNFEEFCHYRDGKARIFQADFARDIESLLRQDEAEDAEFPFILNGGLRTGWSANTIIRDPSWRKGRGPHYPLHISPEDAEKLGVENGTLVRIESRRGAVQVPAKVDANTRPGNLHLPNIFDLQYPDPVTGELKSTGIGINELSDVSDRDPYTGVPNLKRIRCRVSVVATDAAPA